MATAGIRQEAVVPITLENTDKRDNLIAVEKKYQKQWANSRVFEADAPSTTEIPLHSMAPLDLRAKYPKFFGTMAYPYMNGTLHVGHSFTVSKIEFAAGVARMQGRRVLYPQGYHCTGMPIKACADKLVREIEMFGPDFEGYHEDAPLANGVPEPEPPAPTQGTPKTDITKFAAKKTKVAAKSTGLKYQFQIMKALGIPTNEIHRFADPNHWLQFFPPLCKRDLTNFGARIDWRRSFVTTDANPYYDSFVRWQMTRLKELSKIKFGKRYSIYSPKDGQACMDHDRSEGEGIGVQEYTALKLDVKEWSKGAQKVIEEKLPPDATVYIVPATLRPETMYGQTCCFVGPTITYGIYEVKPKEYYFVSERAARNMSFQGIFPKWGVYPKIAELQGSQVVGTLVRAPLSLHDYIRILPMETVKASKGTGVVTSVPSDSPDDYATIIDLAKKPDYYGIQKEWVNLDIIPVLSTPTYGNLTAKYLVETMKINSPKDAKLAEAKDLAYKEGFFKGTMLIGAFKGQPVMEAKEKIRQQLLDSGDAFNYAEPDGFVLSRSGDECVAGYLDQWYLNYGKTEKGGDGEWQEQVLSYVNNGLDTYSSETKNALQQVLDWLHQWPCTRSYGLGSRVPWDEQLLVESLSDSTIYMSYYTIAHLLHKDIFGAEMGPAQVKPEQITDEVWDYIFMRRENVDCDIKPEMLSTMRREFEYWYPLDVRVSGKDLIQNHLTFFLYIHSALFRQELWPRGIRVNGHLLLNGQKMSKSTGNFLTLEDAVKKFGADATRIALADAGDSMDDANFDEKVANAAILRMYELKKWCEEVVKDVRVVASGEEYAEVRDSGRVKSMDTVQRSGERTFWDKLFENEMYGLVHEAVTHYGTAMYKVALKSALYDFTGARDFYRDITKAAGIGMHHSLVRQYVDLQALLVAPIAPHWAEYIWLDVLHHPTSIQHAPFPSVPAPDIALTAARDYVRSTSSNITSAEASLQKRVAKGKSLAFDPSKDKKLTIYVAQTYPAWQDKCIELARELFKAGTLDVGAFAAKLDRAEMKKAMPFVTGLKRRLEGGESAREVFQRKLAFEEVAVLRAMVPGLRQTVRKCVVVEVISVREGGRTGVVVVRGGNGEGDGGAREGEGEGEREERTGLPQPAEGAVPGNPGFQFENVGE